MRYVAAAIVIMLAIVLVPSTVYAQSMMVQPPASGACWGLWNVTINLNQYLLVHVLSNNYSLYVFTPSQYRQWVSGYQSYTVYTQQVISGGTYLVQLPTGQYSVVLYPTPCGVGVNAVVKVVNQPGIGITALGPLITNYIMAYVNLTEFSPEGTIDVALGSMIMTTGTYGNHEYWVVEIMNIQNGEAWLTAYVINVTGKDPVTVNALSKQLGTVGEPYAIYLVLMTNITNGNALVWAGYSVIQNGSYYKEPMIKWIGGASIGVGVSRSIIAMNPYLATPGGYSYDSELVVGNGIGNSQPLIAKVALLYWNGESFMPVTNLYNFAINTNITSTYLTITTCNGLPCIVNGVPNYGLLTSFNVSSVPMTYVEWETPNGSLVSTYITKPMNITYPSTLNSTPGTMLRLVGITVINDGSSELLNATSVVIDPSDKPQVIIVRPDYVRYYLVSIMSLGSVIINETKANNYIGWLRNGSVLVIDMEPNYFNNGTRLMPINGNELLIEVHGPTNVTIGWIRQYLVSVISEYPILVNGSLTTNYVGWFSEYGHLIINASTQYQGNEIRHIPINGTGVYTVYGPINITIGWETQYLVSIASPIPIAVNGAETKNYIAWLNNGTAITIVVPRYYYFGNDTRLVLKTPINGTVIINGPMLINITGSPQYLVTIRSPVPIIVNGTRSRNYTAWVYPNSTIRLSIPKYQIMPNLTLLIASLINVNGHEYPLRGSAILIINSPKSVIIDYRRNYVTYLALALVALLALVMIMRFRGGTNYGHGDDVTTL
ncbi:MAG: hypothetical protein ACP5GZ_09280 [Vulcanisaeta sp.]|uniref:hypothetical protein n=1 Tax=Vulcanisaeta sp. TaxID=2020871 RepID=UPI003D0D9CE3